MATNIGHSFPNLDENGDLITSTTALDGVCTPPLRASTDDHVRRFSERYSSYLQNRDTQTDLNAQQHSKDISQEVDYAVTRAMEKLSLSSPMTHPLGYGFSTRVESHLGFL